MLATLAAIIASQAVISGAYSMTKQAIQLGFLPRMAVRYTSARKAGQIYMPAVNWALLAGVVCVVFFFGSSSALAGAYGIAVTLTMMITTMLTYFVVREAGGFPLPWRSAPPRSSWRWTRCWWRAARSSSSTAAGFRCCSALLLFTVMTTWARGRALLFDSIRKRRRRAAALRRDARPVGSESRPRARRSIRWPIRRRCRRRCCTTSSTTRCCTRRNVILTVDFHEMPWVA